MNYACAAGIGAVSGLRSMAGPALVAEAAGSKRLHLKGTPLAWLGSGNSMKTSAILALGELVADKLPSTPSRLAPAPLVFRAISGAVCGYAVCGRNRTKQEKWGSAIVGASAALAAAWAGYTYRKNSNLPKLVAALAEDAVAMGAGAAVIALIGQ